MRDEKVVEARVTVVLRTYWLFGVRSSDGEFDLTVEASAFGDAVGICRAEFEEYCFDDLFIGPVVTGQMTFAPLAADLFDFGRECARVGVGHNG